MKWMARSGGDAMLTDGIFFLAEYQLFNKPLTWHYKSQRREIIRYLMPFPGVSSINVLTAIRERLCS
jgi:hypothetical protein